MQTSIPRAVNRKYFLVRINREEQRRKREHLGNGTLVTHVTHVFATRNMQCGEVVRIGMDAGRYFPEVWPGDTLLFHHSIEGTLDNRAHKGFQHLLMEDDAFRYYLVHLDQTYAVEKLDSGKMISAPSWILCDEYKEPPLKEVETDSFGRRLVTSDSGLVLFDNYKPAEEEVRQHLKMLEADVQSLSKSGVGESPGLSREMNQRREEVKRAIEGKQQEMERLTRSLSMKNIRPFVLVAGSKTFDRDCGTHIDDSYLIFYYMIGDKVVSIDFKGREYSILKTTQVYFIRKS